MALPLSVAQAEVWLAQKLAPTDSFLNIGGYIVISGTIDAEVFSVG